MKRFSAFLLMLTAAAGLAAADSDKEVAMVPKETLETVKTTQTAQKPATVNPFEGDLKFSGDVRAGLTNASLYQNGKQVRGSQGLNPSTQLDNVKLNFKLDYKAPRLWSSSHLKVDTNLQKKIQENVGLEKLIVGGRLINDKNAHLDTEFGRRRLATAFDSKLQFASMTDGAVVNFTAPQFGNAYLKAAVFVRDVISNPHAAYGFETGLPNIAKSGAFAKYSFVNWDTKKYDNVRTQKQYQYANSQVTVGHQSMPSWLGKTPVRVYAGGLVNHKASPMASAAGSKENYGVYSGVGLGRAAKAGDWMVDAHYQLVGAQAIASFDSQGLRKGNHKGFAVGGAYMVTDSISVRGSANHAAKWKKGVAPTANGNYAKVEIVYGF